MMCHSATLFQKVPCILNACRNSASITSEPQQPVGEISAEDLLSLCGSGQGMLSPDGICKPFSCQTQISLQWSCIKWEISQFGNCENFESFSWKQENSIPSQKQACSSKRAKQNYSMCHFEGGALWLLFCFIALFFSLVLDSFGLLTWTTKQLHDFAGSFPKFSLRQKPIRKFPWPKQTYLKDQLYISTTTSTD